MDMESSHAAQPVMGMSPSLCVTSAVVVGHFRKNVGHRIHNLGVWSVLVKRE